MRSNNDFPTKQALYTGKGQMSTCKHADIPTCKVIQYNYINNTTQIQNGRHTFPTISTFLQRSPTTFSLLHRVYPWQRSPGSQRSSVKAPPDVGHDSSWRRAWLLSMSDISPLDVGHISSRCRTRRLRIEAFGLALDWFRIGLSTTAGQERI